MSEKKTTKKKQKKNKTKKKERKEEEKEREKRGRVNAAYHMIASHKPGFQSQTWMTKCRVALHFEIKSLKKHNRELKKISNPYI